MKRTARIVSFIILWVALLPPIARGALSGSYANGAGMTALNALAGNPFIWSVDQVAGKWVYTYSFLPSGANRGVSFIDLEIGGHVGPDLSYDFSYTTKDPTGAAGLTGTVPVTTLQEQVIDVRPNPAVISTDPKEPAGIEQYQSFAAYQTPGFDLSVTSVISGIQWFLPSWPYADDTSLSWFGMAARQSGMYRGFNSGWTLTVTTSAAPMWGRFFLDGGDWTSNNGWLFARSSQYDNPVRPSFDTSSNYSAQEIRQGWIPVPDFSSGTSGSDGGGNTPPADTTPPTVMMVIPSDGTGLVAVASPATAVFSEPLDPATVTASTFTLTDAGGNPVQGAVSYDAATNTATFTPSTLLTYNETYTAALTTAVKDAAGNPLAALKSWSFTTSVNPGDLDGSGGGPTMSDALLALRMTLGLQSATALQRAACDVAPLFDGKPHPDGKIDGGDVIVILRRVVGLENW